MKFLHTLKKNKSRLSGFTLIELILVIAILALVLVAAVWSINPFAQFAKANDSSREQDIRQIKLALDAYYSDNNCYPRVIPFGQEWKLKNVVYMKKVPQDPSCQSNGDGCYVYQYSGGTCPQWNTVFAKLSKTPVESNCSLASQPSCTPRDMSDQWACETGGQVDCPYLDTVVLSDGSPVPESDQDDVIDASLPTPTPMVIPPQQCEFPRYSCAPSCNDAGIGLGDFCSSNCDGLCAPPH